MRNFDRRKNFKTLLKMDITPWLSLVIAILAFTTPAQASEPRVVCYYTNWSVYRPGTARFNPQNINPYLCTHLIYAFGGFTKDNTLKPFDKYQDIEKGGYAKFTGLKTYNKNLKTMLAIGGWNEGSTRFSPMVAARDRRKEFVRNAIKFLRQNRFDGLDLDWEYPAFRDGGKPKDRENYSKLVRELREEFEREAEKTGKPRLLLTMAVPAGIEYIQKGFDVKTLNQYLDWMNLLTYDYHSAFEPAVNHHAPLFPLEEPNEYSVDSELNIDYTIKFYLENGADRHKLVLGIPTYGRSYTLFNPDAVEIGSPADGPGDQGDATREKGYLAYYEICEALKPSNKKRSISSDEDSDEYSEEVEDEPWTIMRPNPNAMGPVAFKGNQWVGYDDVDIVKKKAEYVAENGLGGIMFWSIDNDDFRGNCHGKPYPLIEAAKESYIAKLGSTDNTIVRDKPKPVSSSSSRRRKNRPRSSSTTTTTTTTTTTPKPASKSNKRKSSAFTSTTPAWNIITPEPPTTPDPGSDFKCTDEGFFQHPRDCKKYFWCLDSGPSNLGIVAHQFTCPSGLFFNKAADSCDFARNVLCKTPSATTKAPTTKAPKTTTTTTTTTTRKPIKLSTKSSVYFRTSTTTTTTPEPEPEESEEEYEDEAVEDSSDIDAEDPKVIKELIDLIKKVGGVEQLEKHLRLGETPASTGGTVTTTQSSFNKKLYQKVLERARGNKFSGNSLLEDKAQNSRRGPQNAGLEPTVDKDKLLRKDRPQYVTINRARSSTTTTTEAALDSEEIEDEPEVAAQPLFKARAVEPDTKVGTTAKPLQYVNIRRARPTLTTSDDADDTASRNTLFERSEPLITVSEAPSSLDITNARRENIPEYVTIRRRRPTIEETTVQYHNNEQEVESQETALEREISSPSSQPQYTSILRTRSTTATPPIEPNSPEPTTVLAVQISSLLNSPSSTEPESEAPEPETTLILTTEITEPSTTTTTSTATSTTTTSTAAPSSLPPRRTILRRRGSTTTTTSTPGPSSTTQVSSRNYTFVRRRRPLSSPNDISLDSDETSELSRKIRSTTPDSREVDGINNSNGETGRFYKYKNRFQSPQSNDDSVAAAALLIQRGRFRPQFNRDEILSLTPIDNETPQEVQKPSFIPRAERRFRSKTSTTAADVIEDSEVSAATVEIRRPNILPRNRGRFTPSSTTEATEQFPSSESSTTQRRPTFTRFTPRPFTRSTTGITTEEKLEEELKIAVTTRRLPPRLPFGRARPSLPSTSTLQARKLPFPSRQLTTQQTLITEHGDDESDSRNDDITLSESAIEEKEHEDEVEEPPKRRIIVKKLRAPGGPTTETTITTEIIPTDESGKRKFRVIRRRPTSTTTTTETIVTSTEAPALVTHRIRKVIRKKLKPAEDEQESEIIAKSVDSLSSYPKETTTETVFNYGEKTKPTVIVSSSVAPTTAELEQETEPATEIITELTKIKINTESTDEIKLETTTKGQPEEKETSEKHNEDADKTDLEEHETKEIKPVEESNVNLNLEKTDLKPDVLVESEEKSVDSSEAKELPPAEPSGTEVEESQPDTTTTSTTRLTSPSTRTRLPYRPPKRLFTSTTESSIPSSSRTFSRKYNPGAYTSPATIEKSSQSFRPTVTRKPLFSSKTFTRRPFTTAKPTQKLEEDEEVYSDEEILEEEPEHKLVILPPNQLFTRPKPEPVNDNEEENYEDSEESSEEVEEETPEEETSKNRFTSTSRKPIFKPRVINSNTFRTSTSTTELPRRQFGTTQNRTAIYNRFGPNKSSSDTKKRVQNVPLGYNTPVGVPKPKINVKETIIENGTQEHITTTNSPIDEKETTTISDDDDYLSMTEATSTTIAESTNTSESTSTNTVEIETATIEMEIDNSTDDYLEITEGSTNYPSTQEFENTQTDFEYQPSPVELSTTVSSSLTYTEVTTEKSPETTTSVPQVSPVIKTQYNKLFSVSRVVEISSKLDKHRLNKNNETTLIEEGKLMIEKKPVVDKIGEVSRFSLIKIFEDEIPIYLTKLGHVYPVDNPPYNPIRIDEARNARALAKHDIPKENLIVSESMNEAYRHVNDIFNRSNDNNNSQVVHVPNDDFLSYINDDKKFDKSEEDFSYPQWQFIPAAYENEKNKQNKAAKSFEIVTPRNMLTDPSTLPLEALFKTENPIMPIKVNSDKTNHPFVVYSAPLPTQTEGGNLVKLESIKPESGRSIITFAKGQEFNGGSAIEETTVKNPINISVLPTSAEATSPITNALTTPNIENFNTSPIIELLTTTPSTTITTVSSTEAQTTHTATTESLSTTETTPDETTTIKTSPLDAKRSKFALPRKSILKVSNITRTYTAPRLAKKINATVISNLNVKPNKTSGFNPSKSRFSAIRTQNVPVDVRKKPSTPKTFTTEAPKTTTERKLYFKPIRPNLRPAFVPRKNTTPPPTVSGDT